MIIIIIGFTGQGKTTLAEYLSRRSTTRLKFDPRMQFHTTDDILPNASGLYELLDDRYEVIVQPGRGAEVKETFNETCGVLADWIEHNPEEVVSFVADEARLIGLQNENVSLNFDWILRSAREGSPITVIITCHRPVDVHPNIRAIANRIIFFRVMLPGDLDTIEDQAGPEVREAVRNLVDKQFVTWNNSRQQYRKISDANSWKVDLERRAVNV